MAAPGEGRLGGQPGKGGVKKKALTPHPIREGEKTEKGDKRGKQIPLSKKNKRSNRGKEGGAPTCLEESEKNPGGWQSGMPAQTGAPTTVGRRG